AVLPARPGVSSWASSDGSDTRGDAASALLERLTSARRNGSPRQVAALAAPGDRAAVREIRTLRANVHALGITDLSLRYVDEDEGRIDAHREAQLGGQAWVGDVQLGWRLHGWDAKDSHLEITMTF